MATNKIFIYVLKDPETHHIRYVGQTNNIKRRLQAHISRARYRKYHSARWITSLLNRNLRPILEIVEECNRSNLTTREQFWIAHYRKEYDLTNITNGGEGCVGYSSRLGSRWTDKQRLNYSVSRKGIKVNHTTQGNYKRKLGITKYFLGTKKPILQYTLDGIFIKEYESCVDAATILKLAPAGIRQCCYNRQQKCGDYMWKFKTQVIALNIKPFEKININFIPILQLDINGNILQEFKSIKDASEKLNILRTSITNCLCNRSSTAGGFCWKYK